MNMLEKILMHKRKEIEGQKKRFTVSYLEKSPFFQRPTRSLKNSLLHKNSSGIIAEFKRRSPTAKSINEEADVGEVTTAYTQYGASGLSVLTDRKYFHGDHADLSIAALNPIPLLRKDFIIDEYQLAESRALGADVILLIAACLSKQEVKNLSGLAYQLGLEVMLEIHETAELSHLNDQVSMVSVNNRNLHTGKTEPLRCLRIIEELPSDIIRIAASGLETPDYTRILRSVGYQGFLIGEFFMRQKDPGLGLANFIREHRRS